MSTSLEVGDDNSLSLPRLGLELVILANSSGGRICVTTPLSFLVCPDLRPGIAGTSSISPRAEDTSDWTRDFVGSSIAKNDNAVIPRRRSAMSLGLGGLGDPICGSSLATSLGRTLAVDGGVMGACEGVTGLIAAVASGVVELRLGRNRRLCNLPGSRKAPPVECARALGATAAVGRGGSGRRCMGNGDSGLHGDISAYIPVKSSDGIWMGYSESDVQSPRKRRPQKEGLPERQAQHSHQVSFLVVGVKGHARDKHFRSKDERNLDSSVTGIRSDRLAERR